MDTIKFHHTSQARNRNELSLGIKTNVCEIPDKLKCLLCLMIIKVVDNSTGGEEHTMTLRRKAGSKLYNVTWVKQDSNGQGFLQSSGFFS